MNQRKEQLRTKLHGLSQEWIAHGLPSTEVLNQTAQALHVWKQSQGVQGIWPHAPLMISATIDDGIGQGIEIISQYAEVTGLRVERLGLMQPPDLIIAACRQHHPAILGLTILQLDSDEALAHIGSNLPPHTALVAGGPVFKFDPHMAGQCGVTYVAANVAYFIDYLLNWELGHGVTT